MVLTKSPLNKHRTTAITNLKDEGTITNVKRKTNLVKLVRSPDKIATKPNNPKMKPSIIKGLKILKSASVTKKNDEISKIPVPLSKSSTFKQITVQKHKMKTIPKKKILEPQPPKQEQFVNTPTPTNKSDVKFVMIPKDKSSPKFDKFTHSDVAARVKQLKKHDTENFKRIKNQYFSSVLADIRKTDLETTLRKYAANENTAPTEIKKKKRKSIKKKSSPKVHRMSPRIVSQNEYSSINSLKKETPSLTTHYLEADSQTSRIPVTKKPFKIVKQKKSPRAKLNSEGKDAKSTQLSQHKKKSKSHTLKLNRVQSSDSVPNLPIREIKHNDSFVLSAKKLENSSTKRTTRHKKSPQHLKLTTQRPTTAHQTFRTAEPKNDRTKPEQLKSCLKKTWDENDFTAVNTKYEMNFGLVPLIVN